MKLVLFIALIAFHLSACQLLSHKERPPLKQAVLSSPSQALSMELEAIITKQLYGQSVKLADNVFTEQSLISIEPKRHINIQSESLVNRQLPTISHVFSLLKSGEDCFLYHHQSEEYIMLDDIQCQINLSTHKDINHHQGEKIND